MAQANTQDVIRRKTERGRLPPDAAPMTVARALALALAKSAQDLLSLPMRTTQLADRRMTLADLPEALPPQALLALIAGPGEALGLVALAPPLVAALIEMQTMGRLGGVAPPARRPTRTDASLAQGYIDAVLAGFEAALAEMDEVVWAGGFRYASYLEEPRPLGFLLEDTGYRVFDAGLVLGDDGARQGGLLLALPAHGRGPGPRRGAGADGTDAAPGEAALWSQRLHDQVLGCPAALDAVLHRLTLPLAQVLSFAEGATLPIPRAALEDLRLEGEGGGVVAHGRLGQNGGFRALRLSALHEVAMPPPGAAAETSAAALPSPPPRRTATTAPSRPPPAAAPAPPPLPMPEAPAEPLPDGGDLPPLRIGMAM